MKRSVLLLLLLLLLLKMEKSWTAEEVAASQEELCSMKSANFSYTVIRTKRKNEAVSQTVIPKFLNEVMDFANTRLLSFRA